MDDDQLQLFAISGSTVADPTPASNGHGTIAAGTVAEMLLVAELLKRGHKIALPVVDDDSVDLIVNYRITVQVKSSGWRDRTGALKVIVNKRNQHGERTHCPLPSHVDILAVYASDTNAWWHMPRSAVGQSRTVSLCERAAGGRSAWRDAWHLYGQ